MRHTVDLYDPWDAQEWSYVCSTLQSSGLWCSQSSTASPIHSTLMRSAYSSVYQGSHGSPDCVQILFFVKSSFKSPLGRLLRHCLLSLNNKNNKNSSRIGLPCLLPTAQWGSVNPNSLWRVLFKSERVVCLYDPFFLFFACLETFNTECSFCDVSKAELLEEKYGASCSKYPASLIFVLLRPIKSAIFIL